MATVGAFLPEAHEPADWPEASFVDAAFLLFKSSRPPRLLKMKPHAHAAIIFKNSRRLIDMVVSNAINIKKVLDIHKYKVRNSISA